MYGLFYHSWLSKKKKEKKKTSAIPSDDSAPPPFNRQTEFDPKCRPLESELRLVTGGSRAARGIFNWIYFHNLKLWRVSGS